MEVGYDFFIKGVQYKVVWDERRSKHILLVNGNEGEMKIPCDEEFSDETLPAEAFLKILLLSTDKDRESFIWDAICRGDIKTLSKNLPLIKKR